MTLATRLKLALEKRNISQAEAARRCGISQQSMNYIISNNLNTSKLAMQIASALEINPDWLIYGRGKSEETKFYEIPIIHSPFMLKKLLDQNLDDQFITYTVTEISIHGTAFAYLITPNQLLLCQEINCSQLCNSINTSEYLEEFLCINNQNWSVSVRNKPEELSFLILEKRIRNADF